MQILIRNKVINRSNNKKIKILAINLLTNRINSKTMFKKKKTVLTITLKKLIKK
jgi:hypothetical protein